VRIKVDRKSVTFAGGLIGLTVETVYSVRYNQAPDSGLLVLFATMLGLPAFLTLDTKDKDRDDDGKPRTGDNDRDEREDNTPSKPG
jgi:hypothetical protein